RSALMVIGRKPDIGTFLGTARLAFPAGFKEFASMSAQAYRRYAAECLEMSLAVADPQARALLKRMAIAWADLADAAENSPQTPKSFLQKQQGSRPPMGLDFDKLTPDEQRRVLDGLDLKG